MSVENKHIQTVTCRAFQISTNPSISFCFFYNNHDMFSFIGLRFGARIISPTLSVTTLALSRRLFLSHFQTRSFLTTSRLALATTGTAKKSVAKITHTASKKKSTSEKRVTAKKKTPTKKKTLTKKKTPLKKKASVKPKRGIFYFSLAPLPVFLLRFSDYSRNNRPKA